MESGDLCRVHSVIAPGTFVDNSADVSPDSDSSVKLEEVEASESDSEPDSLPEVAEDLDCCRCLNVAFLAGFPPSRFVRLMSVFGLSFFFRLDKRTRLTSSIFDSVLADLSFF